MSLKDKVLQEIINADRPLKNADIYLRLDQAEDSAAISTALWNLKKDQKIKPVEAPGKGSAYVAVEQPAAGATTVTESEETQSNKTPKKTSVTEPAAEAVEQASLPSSPAADERFAIFNDNALLIKKGDISIELSPQTTLAIRQQMERMQ